MSQFKTAVGLTESTAVNSALAKRVELCVFCIAGMYQRLPTEQAAFSVFSAESKDKRGLDLISDALPFGRLLYGGPHGVSNAIGYAQHFSRSHDAVIRVYDDAANVIERTSTRASSKNDDLLLNFLPDV